METEDRGVVDERHIRAIKEAKDKLGSWPFPWDSRWVLLTRDQYIEFGGDPATWDNMKCEDEEYGDSLP